MAPTRAVAPDDRPPTLLRLATAGSVDDGKSTLVGRLLLRRQVGARPTSWTPSSRSAAQGLARRHDLALLTDGLRAEREQGITIDVAYRYFATAAPHVHPGRLPRATCSTPATPSPAPPPPTSRAAGRRPQRRRRADPAPPGRRRRCCGCRTWCWRSTRDRPRPTTPRSVFTRIATDFASLARSLNVPDTHCIPVSATEGDNVVTRSTRTPWYEGRPCSATWRPSTTPAAGRRGAALPGAAGGATADRAAAPWAARRPELTATTAATPARSRPAGSGRGRDRRPASGLRTPRRGHRHPDGPLDVAVAGQSVILPAGRRHRRLPR